MQTDQPRDQHCTQCVSHAVQNRTHREALRTIPTVVCNPAQSNGRLARDTSPCAHFNRRSRTGRGRGSVPTPGVALPLGSSRGNHNRVAPQPTHRRSDASSRSTSTAGRERLVGEVTNAEQRHVPDIKDDCCDHGRTVLGRLSLQGLRGAFGDPSVQQRIAGRRALHARMAYHLHQLRRT